MLNEIFAPLKSGTDIRGTAVNGVPGEYINLSVIMTEYLLLSIWARGE